MWDDVKQMNALAITLTVITVLGLAWVAVTWIVRQPSFAFREVVVIAPLSKR
jgi:hypothetical protein